MFSKKIEGELLTRNALAFIPVFGGLEVISRKLRWRDTTVLRTSFRLGEEASGL